MNLLLSQYYLPVERWREKQLRDDYLLLLWNKQKACNFGASTSNKELCEELGIEYNGEAVQICKYLQGKGWIQWEGFAWIHLTQLGREKAEEMDNERFEAKENLVLQALYKARNTHPNGVATDELALAVNLELRDVYDVISELERKGWIGGSDERVWILPAGIKKIERVAEPPIPTFVINNPQNSPMSFGAHSSQTVTYNNQAVQDVLPALSRLIEDLHALDFPMHSDVIAELKKVEVLAKSDMDVGKWQMIQSRLVTTKTALEIAKIAADSLPYWPIVWNFFFK